MAIHFYEFAHGKRKEGPRAALLKRFDQSEIAAAEQTASKWNQFKYLKQRHLIVELRREQFTLRDSYIERHLRHTPPEPDLDPVHLDFDAEIPVFPLGLVGAPFSDLVFKPDDKLNPFTQSVNTAGIKCSRLISVGGNIRHECTFGHTACSSFCQCI